MTMENHTSIIQWHHFGPCGVTSNKGSRPLILGQCLYISEV